MLILSQDHVDQDHADHADQDHVPCSFAYKVVCIDGRFTKPAVVFRGENTAYEFIKAIPKEYKTAKK